MNATNKPARRRWWQYLLVALLYIIFSNIGRFKEWPSWVWLILLFLSVILVATWQRRRVEAEDHTEAPTAEPPPKDIQQEMRRKGSTLKLKLRHALEQAALLVVAVASGVITYTVITRALANDGLWFCLTGAAAGALIGLVPFFIAKKYNQTKLGKIALLSCTIAGIVLGLFLGFLNARHSTRQKADQQLTASARQLVSDLNSLQDFVKDGAVGNVPELKPTGDADFDAVLQTLRDFYKEYFRRGHKMNHDLEALQEIYVFDDLLLTNKPSLESEIQKRIAGQRVIAEFATNALPMVVNFKAKCALLNISEGSKTNILNEIDKIAPLVASVVRLQKAQQDFLQFLDDNFDGYEVKGGKPLFGSQTNAQKYAEFSKNIGDAATDMVKRGEELQKGGEELQKFGMAEMESAKLKLQKP